jgi:hypothetical protein
VNGEALLGADAMRMLAARGLRIFGLCLGDKAFRAEEEPNGDSRGEHRVAGGKGVRAATYRRVSTDEQTYGYSLGAQRELTAAEVARRGWTLVGEYEDAGISGASTNRPAWNSMLEACRRGETDAVVVHAISRFSRTRLHTEVTLDEFTGLALTWSASPRTSTSIPPVGGCCRGL